MRMLDPGGTGGGGGGSTNDSAADELESRDPGSGDGGGGGGGIDAGDVTDIVNDDINDSSGSGDAADELTDRDPGSTEPDDSGGGDTNQDAREELTDRDQASGDGSSGSQDRSIDEGITSGDGDTTTGDGQSADEQQQDAPDELTGRDPGSGDGEDTGTTPEEELTEQDPGSESQPDEIPDSSAPEDDASLLEQAQEEGLASLERGGAVSEAGRDLVADVGGVVFQNPEQSVLTDIGISEARLRRRNTQLSGPAITGIDFDREGAQSFEFEYGESGTVDETVVDDLTAGGGFLTDEQRTNIQEDIEQRQETFDLGDEAASAAEEVGASEDQAAFARGVGRVPADFVSAPAGATLATDTAVEVGRNLPSAVDASGAGAVAGTSLELAGRGVESVIRGAEANPEEFAGSLAGGAVGGAVAGRAAGGATRFGRDRVRTAGAETFELDDGTIVNPGTGKFYSPRSGQRNPEDRFPGAEDPDVYESDPPKAVREQAEDFTPESVNQRFEEAGVEGGTTMKKAVDVEPDKGPGKGFETQEGSYESPGGFVGPELSPNFLGVEGGRRSFSLRPGLPDTGDRATGVFVRTRVEASDAETLDEFNEELLDRAGETTARTKPASEVNTGEIEAVIPPEAEFADIGGGPVRAVARRAGVGSDFAVRIGGRTIPGTDRKVGGRKIPIRPVADPDLMDTGGSRGFGDFLESERGQLGADAASGPRTQSLGEIQRPTQAPTDRPLPVVPTTPTASSTGVATSEPSRTETSDPASTGTTRGPESSAGSSTTSSTDGSADGSAVDVTSPVFESTSSSGGGSAPSGGPASSPASDPLDSPPGGSAPPSTGSGSGPGAPGSPGSPPSSPGSPPITEFLSSGGSSVPTDPARGTSPLPDYSPESSNEKRRRDELPTESFEERFEFGIAAPEDILDG